MRRRVNPSGLNFRKLTFLNQTHPQHQGNSSNLLNNEGHMLFVSYRIKMNHAIMVHEFERNLCVPEKEIHYRSHSTCLGQIMNWLIEYRHNTDLFFGNPFWFHVLYQVLNLPSERSLSYIRAFMTWGSHAQSDDFEHNPENDDEEEEIDGVFKNQTTISPTLLGAWFTSLLP